jgi:hypothetical protein
MILILPTDYFYTALRLLWLRSRARVNRWKEEVELVAEEMKRVERYLTWEKDEWITAATKRRDAMGISPDDDPIEAIEQLALDEGLVAYGYHQADLHMRMRCHFKYLWRYVDGWQKDPGSIPTARYWYAECIQPDKSEWLYK